MKIYLAGPDVFRPNAIEHGQKLKKLCSEYGFEGMYPFDNEVDMDLKGPELAKVIYEANKKMIEECDVVIANLVPFRGPSADPGTVWEIGYALGLGKKVMGYRDFPSPEEDPRAIYKNRANEAYGWSVEDFDLGDNLMIDCSIPIYRFFIDALTQLRGEQQSGQTGESGS